MYFRKFLNLIVFMTHELTKVKCKETVMVISAVKSSKNGQKSPSGVEKSFFEPDSE